MVLLVASLACARGNLPVVPTPAGATPTTSTELLPGAGLVTPDPPAATPTPTESLPIDSLEPSPSPIPTLDAGAEDVVLYTTQAGDHLQALAFRFGVGIDEIRPAQPLEGDPLLDPGQLLLIPRRLGETTPSRHLIPDSELVFSASGAGFDVSGYVQRQNGYLARYRGFVAGRTLTGAQIVERIADEHSVNPRLLLGLVEYYSGWVTNPDPDPSTLLFPLQYPSGRDNGLYHQLSWAADKLNVGYYAWRAGHLGALTFTDGTSLRLAPDLNAGTVALQYFLSLNHDRDEWLRSVSDEGFIASFTRAFGNPFERAVEPLLPKGLRQPPMELPFLPGRRWSYTGGPHGAWEREGAVAAIDFGPPSTEHGCAESDEWVTASAAGVVVRVGDGVLMLDLDGDGREQTGWVLFHMHIAEAGRVRVGTMVETGDLLGHPSCEGGWATGTHLHFARKYNGEWISTDGPLPFVLSGWVARNGNRPYYGYLEKDGVRIASCTCASPDTWISR